MEQSLYEKNAEDIIQTIKYNPKYDKNPIVETRTVLVTSNDTTMYLVGKSTTGKSVIVDLRSSAIMNALKALAHRDMENKIEKVGGVELYFCQTRDSKFSLSLHNTFQMTTVIDRVACRTYYMLREMDEFFPRSSSTWPQAYLFVGRKEEEKDVVRTLGVMDGKHHLLATSIAHGDSA